METTRYVFLNDLSNEDLDIFLKNINYSIVPTIIMKFAKDNSKFFKDQLSGNAKKSFDKVMSKKETNQDFIKNYIFKHLDKDLESELYFKIVRKLFKGNDDICNSFLNQESIDNLSVVEFINHSGDSKSAIEAFLSFCKFDYKLSDEEQKKINESSKIEELEAELKEVKQQLEESKNDKEDANKNIKKKNDEIVNVKKENTTLKNQIEALKKEIIELKENSPTFSDIKTSKESDIDTVEDNENDSVKPSVDPQVVCEQLQKKTFLGTVKPEDIDLEKGWVLITPLVPIIGENSNINKYELQDYVDYRNDYSTFIMYITNEEQNSYFFDEDEIYNYRYSTETEKHDMLETKLSNKVLSFRLVLKPVKNGKRKLNACLVDEPKTLKNFTNSLFVPFVDMSKSKFEKTVSDHKEITLNNYSNILNMSLKYVYVEDSIYEINYVPSTTGYTNENKWKFKADSDENNGLPFKLLRNVSSLGEDDFIETKNLNHSHYGIYVKNIVLFQKENNTSAVYNEQEFIKRVVDNASAKNLYYSERDIKNFHIAVKSSKLVILAGPSGIGKSKLPFIYANTLGLSEAKKNVLFVPISPSYVEPEDVLGYIKPLSNVSKSNDELNKDNETDESNELDKNCEFIESQSELVSFLNRASENKDKIFFVIFDEMNLSQIEYWFAPFLSILEQDTDSRTLKLYSDNLKAKNGDIYPSTIDIGDNVFFIGTVNIDDTTKKLSDRLLDRSIVVNLNPPSFENLKTMAKEETRTSLEEVSFSKFESSIAQVENPAIEFNEEEIKLLNQIKDLITKSFGRGSISFRGLKKIALYLKNSNSLLDRGVAFDNALAEIVFSKLSGTAEEFDILASEYSEDSIYSCFNSFSNISNFEFCKKILNTKLDEIKKYGFTR